MPAINSPLEYLKKTAEIKQIESLQVIISTTKKTAKPQCWDRTLEITFVSPGTCSEGCFMRWKIISFQRSFRAIAKPGPNLNSEGYLKISPPKESKTSIKSAGGILGGRLCSCDDFCGEGTWNIPLTKRLDHFCRIKTGRIPISWNRGSWKELRFSSGLFWIFSTQYNAF